MHSWLLWVAGWLCYTAAAYLQFKEAGALLVLGTALTRASGILPDTSSFAALLASVASIFKPAVKL